MISSKTHVKTLFEDEGESFKQQLTHRLTAKQHIDRFLTVEGKDGKYLNVRYKLDNCREDLRVIMYHRSKAHYLFCFALINEKEKFDRKHHYFFVNKTIKDVEQMGEDNHTSLVNFEQEVTVLLGNTFEGTKKEILEGFTRQMPFSELI